MSYPFIQSIIIALGILQGLFLIITLFRFRKLGPKSNNTLLLFLIFVTITLMANMFFVLGLLPKYPHVGFLMDNMYFLFGPLLYLYVGGHLKKSIVFQKRQWIHFLLPGIHVISMIQYLMVSPRQFYRIMTQEGIWQYPYDQALAIISITFYLFLSWRLYIRNKKGDKARRERSLEVIFFLILISVLLWINQYSVQVFGFRAGVGIKRFTNPWTFFPLITIFLGYYALGKSNFFRAEKERKRYEGSTLTESQTAAIKEKLEDYMEKERPFLNPRLTQDELSDLLDVNKKDLSRVINEFYELNFFDFINTYRIDEFKRLATPENIQKHNIMALALDAGFNSKSAFNKVFRRLENCTPSEYLKRKRSS